MILRLDFMRPYTRMTQTLGGEAFITGCFPKISDESLMQLNTVYTDQEIYIAIMDMNPPKAPGSDGLPTVFYLKAWMVVGASVSKFVRSILEGEKRLWSAFEALIVLIPKVDHPSQIIHF